MEQSSEHQYTDIELDLSDKEVDALCIDYVKDVLGSCSSSLFFEHLEQGIPVQEALLASIINEAIIHSISKELKRFK